MKSFLGFLNGRRWFIALPLLASLAVGAVAQEEEGPAPAVSLANAAWDSGSGAVTLPSGEPLAILETVFPALEIEALPGDGVSNISVSVFYTAEGMSEQQLAMSGAPTGGVFATTMPALPRGQVAFYFVAQGLLGDEPADAARLPAEGGFSYSVEPALSLQNGTLAAGQGTISFPAVGDVKVVELREPLLSVEAAVVGGASNLTVSARYSAGGGAEQTVSMGYLAEAGAYIGNMPSLPRGPVSFRFVAEAEFDSSPLDPVVLPATGSYEFEVIAAQSLENAKWTAGGATVDLPSLSALSVVETERPIISIEAQTLLDITNLVVDLKYKAGSAAEQTLPMIGNPEGGVFAVEMPELPRGEVTFYFVAGAMQNGQAVAVVRAPAEGTFAYTVETALETSGPAWTSTDGVFALPSAEDLELVQSERPTVAITASPTPGVTNVSVQVFYREGSKTATEKSIDLEGDASGGRFEGRMPITARGEVYFYFKSTGIFDNQPLTAMRSPADDYYSYTVLNPLDLENASWAAGGAPVNLPAVEEPVTGPTSSPGVSVDAFPLGEGTNLLVNVLYTLDPEGDEVSIPLTGDAEGGAFEADLPALLQGHVYFRFEATVAFEDTVLDAVRLPETGYYQYLSTPLLLKDPTWSLGAADIDLTIGEPEALLMDRPILSVEAEPVDAVENIAVRVVYAASEEVDPEKQALVLDGDPDGGVFAGEMPPFSKGWTYFYYLAEAELPGVDLEPVRLPETGYFRYSTEEGMSPKFEPDIEDWGLSSGQNYNTLFAYWDGSAWSQMPPSQAEFVNSWVSGGVSYNMIYPGSILIRNVGTRVIRSPRLEGVGSLFFKALSTRPNDVETHILEIQTSSDANGPWTTVEIVEVPRVGSEFTSFMVEINDYSDSVFVRIARTSTASHSNNNIAIKDMVLSPPPAAVLVEETAAPQPGDPTDSDDLTFFAYVENFSEKWPAIDIQPMLVWRFNGGTYSYSNMVSLGEGDYSVVLPSQGTGVLEYYLAVEFAGSGYDYGELTDKRSPTYLGWDGSSAVNTELLVRTEPLARPLGVRAFGEPLLSNPVWAAGPKVVPLTVEVMPQTGLVEVPTLSLEMDAKDNATNFVVQVVYSLLPDFSEAHTVLMEGDSETGEYAVEMPQTGQGTTYFYFEATGLFNGAEMPTARLPLAGNFRYDTLTSITMSNPTWQADGSPVSLPAGVDPVTGMTQRPTVGVDAVVVDDGTGLGVRAHLTTSPESGAEHVVELDSQPGGDTFAGELPIRPAGVTHFYFTAYASYAGGAVAEVRYPRTGYYTYRTTSEIGYDRKNNPAAWGINGTITQTLYHWDGNSWLTFGQPGFDIDGAWLMSYVIGIPSMHPNDILLRNQSGANSFVRSPKLDGIGTVYFKAMPVLTHEEIYEVAVETAPGPNGPWTERSLVEVPVSSQYTEYSLELNDYSNPIYVRIRRVSTSSVDASHLAIKDIVISPPPADVVVSETSIPTPGYPSKEEAITFYAHVDNVSSSYPAQEISPKLVWRIGKSDFEATPMEHIGGGDYQVTLPPQTPGKFEYHIRVDFAGSSFVYGEYNETRSPALLGWDGESDVNTVQLLHEEPLVRPFPVRMFYSYHNVVELRRFDTMEALPMRLVGDQVWQSVLYITNAVAMNLKFAGTKPYYENATEYSYQDEVFSDDSQETTNPPLTGKADMGDYSDVLVTVSNYVGTVMFRFNVTNGVYEVRKASFQDFNSWQASHNYFEESLGLFAIQNFDTDLENIPVTRPASTVFTDFNLVANALSQIPDPPFSPVEYAMQWRLENAWVIKERMAATNFVAGETPYANQAVRIHAGAGTLQSTAEIHTRGRDALKFKSRIAFGDSYMPHYLPGFALKNYKFKTKFTPNEISPANPSVSVIGYRRDMENFYELRLTQNRNLTASSNTGRDDVRMQLYRCNNGEFSEIGKAATVTSRSLDAGTWEVELAITNVSASAVGLTATIKLGSGAETVLTASESNAGVLANGGTIAFNVNDALVNFYDMQLLNATTGGSLADLAVKDNWYLGGRPAGGAPGETRWTFDGTNMKRPLRPVFYDVEIVRVGTDSSLPSQPVWEVVQDGAGQATSLKYPAQPETLNIKTWDNTFVRIKPRLADGMLVVDDLGMNDWRGLDITDPEEVPVNDPNSNTVWRATESYVAQRGGMRKLELTRSRANPEARQMLVSPRCDDGVGTVSFNYEATGGNVRFVVERASFDSQTADNDPWEMIADPVDVAPNESDSFYVPVRTNMIGRVRIRIEDAGTDPAATLWLDTVRVTSYPKQDNTSWEAYNVLINPPETNPETDEKQFEPEDLSTRSAFLNNSPDEDVSPAALLEDAPYIQSPVIETGIGEIGFWFRSWDPDAEYPGRIKLMAAPSPDSTNWVEIAIPDDPEADAAYKSRLGNIRNEAYEYFTIEIFDIENKVLRIYGVTNESSRVAVDNIIVTEPVRSSIDIESVTMNPAIPLTDEPVHVTVRLANPRMSPENIAVKLYYYFGTNTWGASNWIENDDYTGVINLEEQGDQFTFATPPSQPIPGQPVDAVVQYQVVVTYTGTFPAPVEYNDFENPEWYYPVDLNEQYQSRGFSPHYFVFSCPTGAVFFNEFFYAYNAAYYNEEFIEIIGPRNASLKNWRVDVVDAARSEFSDTVITSYTLPSDAYLKEGINGWGFYVLGDTGAISDNVDYHFPDGGNPEITPSESANLPISGGFRLVRGMGAYVDLISYGASSIAKVEMVERGYTYTRDRATFGLNANRAIGLTMDSMTGELGWDLVTIGQESPGAMNPGEEFVLGEIDPYPEPGEEPEAVAALLLEIRNIQLEAGQVELSVWADSANEVSDLTGWTGVVEANAAPDAGAGWDTVPGTSTQFSEIGEYPFSFNAPASPVFFRVKATNPAAE